MHPAARHFGGRESWDSFHGSSSARLPATSQAASFPGDEGYGPIGGLIAGIVGAFVGGWLFALLTNKKDWLTGIDITTIIAAIVGAIIVVFVFQMMTGRRRV